MSKINFIACVNWVKKGVAKEVPEKVDLNKDELKRLIEEARQNVQNLEDEWVELIKQYVIVMLNDNL